MEQVWEWRSANPEDWQQLTDSFYKAVSSSAVCAVGIINERYKEFFAYSCSLTRKTILPTCSRGLQTFALVSRRKTPVCQTCRS